MENPKRARSWKRRLRPRANLKNDVPVLYSTYDVGSRACSSLHRGSRLCAALGRAWIGSPRQLLG